MEQPEIVNIHLHASDGENLGDRIRFRLHNTINLIGKRATIQLTNFQALNSIYNIDKTNNSFMGGEITPGFYDAIQLLRSLTGLLGGNNIDTYFDESTLRYVFKSDTAFVLTGTLLEYLNIFDGSSKLVNGEYTVQSSRAFDLYKKAHFVFVVCENLRTTSHVGLEVNTRHVTERIGRVPIKLSFGDYIVYNEENASKSMIFENSVKMLDIRIVNDFNESVLMDEDFGISFSMEIWDIGDDRDFLLNTIEPPKKGLFDYLHYPVVNKELPYLMTVRDKYAEFVKTVRKNAMKEQGLEDDEVDAIQVKLDEINKLVKERKNQ